jgi:hypothetical protein
MNSYKQDGELILWVLGILVYILFFWWVIERADWADIERHRDSIIQEAPRTSLDSTYKGLDQILVQQRSLLTALEMF